MTIIDIDFEDVETEDVEPRWCEAIVRQATRIDPPEGCDEEAAPGSDYCEAHDPDNEPDYERDIDQDYWIERDSEDLWHDSGE